MGFKSGRVTCMRYWVSGESPLPWTEAVLDKVRDRLAGKNQPSESADGSAVGWSGGDHLLDLTVELGKNVIDEALHLAIRIDTDKIPGSLLRAYTKMETDALSKDNPSGFPTKAQRQEAKETALARAQTESEDGRFRRMKQCDLLWDGSSNILYAGNTSASMLDRIQTLFRETFDRTLEPITAGTLAQRLASDRDQTQAMESTSPAIYWGNEPLYSAVAWPGVDPLGRDFWGNEFLIWLWHTLQADGDVISLPDGSDVTVMMAKTLVLDCPRGETGRDTLSDEGPTRMPEAFRALQAGKLPRKVGLILVRHGIEYDLTLQAESLAVSGLNIPKPEGASGSEAHIARIESLRHVFETLDLLYDVYGRKRLDQDWTGELTRIKDWLSAA